jgi:hypothetical protein
MDRINILHDALKRFKHTTNNHITGFYNRLTSIEVDQCMLEHKTACDLKSANQRIQALEANQGVMQQRIHQLEELLVEVLKKQEDEEEDPYNRV